MRQEIEPDDNQEHYNSLEETIIHGLSIANLTKKILWVPEDFFISPCTRKRI